MGVGEDIVLAASDAMVGGVVAVVNVRATVDRSGWKRGELAKEAVMALTNIVNVNTFAA